MASRGHGQRNANLPDSETCSAAERRVQPTLRLLSTYAQQVGSLLRDFSICGSDCEGPKMPEMHASLFLNEEPERYERAEFKVFEAFPEPGYACLGFSEHTHTEMLGLPGPASRSRDLLVLHCGGDAGKTVLVLVRWRADRTGSSIDRGASRCQRHSSRQFREYPRPLFGVSQFERPEIKQSEGLLANLGKGGKIARLLANSTSESSPSTTSRS